MKTIILKLSSLKPNVIAEESTLGNAHCILYTATSNPIPPEIPANYFNAFINTNSYRPFYSLNNFQINYSLFLIKKWLETEKCVRIVKEEFIAKIDFSFYI